MMKSVIWLHDGVLDTLNDAFVHITANVTPLFISQGMTVIIQPGCTISGRAVELALNRDVFVFVSSKGATKLYSWVPVPASLRNFLTQVTSCMHDGARGAVARWMLKKRFGRELHPAHSLSVIRGIEGAAVRDLYRKFAEQYDIRWDSREKHGTWSALSPLNRTISLCNAALYGLTEMAVLRAGCSPQFGYVHSSAGERGKSLVYDIADMVKFTTVTPLAFQYAADGKASPEWRARAACARMFRTSDLLERLTRITEDAIHVGEQHIASAAPRRRRKPLP